MHKKQVEHQDTVMILELITAIWTIIQNRVGKYARKWRHRAGKDDKTLST
jgi:hypothetical protein